MNPEIDARFKLLEDAIQQIANRKTPIEQAISIVYQLFWNWSFAVGLAMGMMLFPFVCGESNTTFRLPNPIRWFWKTPNPNPSPNPSPTPSPTNLKTLMPKDRPEQLSTLLERLEQVNRNLQNNLYKTELSAKAAIREATALQDNASEWEPFSREFNARFNSCSNVEDIGHKLNTIITEISP